MNVAKELHRLIAALILIGIVFVLVGGLVMPLGWFLFTVIPSVVKLDPLQSFRVFMLGLVSVLLLPMAYRITKILVDD